MAVLGWLCGILLAAIVLLLVLPMRLRLSLRTDPAFRSFLVVWPFGGTIFPLRVFDTTRKGKTTPDKPAKKRRKRSRSGRGRAEALLTLPQTLGRMIRSIHFEELRINGEFGLGDPAETGQLYGQLTPIIYTTGHAITLRPNFDQACLHGRADAQVRVIPIAFLWPIAGFLWRMFGPWR